MSGEILRAFIAAEPEGSMPPCPATCTCLGEAVVRGGPTSSVLVGWLHAVDCQITEALIHRLEA